MHLGSDSFNRVRAEKAAEGSLGNPGSVSHFVLLISAELEK